MATTRKTIRPAARPAINAHAPGLGEGEEITDVPGDATPEPDDLQLLMAELAGNQSSNVTVYRTGKGVQRAYVFKCDAASFSLDVLRDKYNGGEFQLFITKDGRLWKNRTVTIEPPQAVHEPLPPAAPDVVSAMREGFQKQAELMANVVKTLAVPAPAPKPLLEGVNITELVGGIAALLQVLRPPTPVPQAPPVETYINVLMKGIELAKDVKGDGGEGDTSLLGLVKELIKSPMLSTAMQATLAQAQAQAPAAPQRPQVPMRPRPPAPPPAATAPSTPAASPAQPTPSFAGETSVHPMLPTYLGILVSKAAAQSDPAIYADLVLDNLDDAQLTQLLGAEPTPVDWLATINPGVNTHRVWFETLVRLIDEALETVDPEPLDGVPLAPPLNAGDDYASGPAAPTVPGEPAAG